MEKIANAPIRVKRAYGAFSVILTPDSSNVVLTLTEAGLEIVATFARGSTVRYYSIRSLAGAILSGYDWI